MTRAEFDASVQAEITRLIAQGEAAARLEDDSDEPFCDACGCAMTEHGICPKCGCVGGAR